MKIKCNNLLAPEGKLLTVALMLISSILLSQSTYTFAYTGNTQSLSLSAGTYSIEAWGGDGYTQTAGYNGRGGYASGILTLNSAQTVYINVGGLGSYPSGGVNANTWTFNGGGIGYPAANSAYGNGGGASDVRTVGGSWDNPASLASRAIVAGGGGAGRNSSYIGGNGGGLTGGTGTYFSPDQTGGPTGGSQNAGGTNTGYTSGLTTATLGMAMTWNGGGLTATFLAGGGGGYYGGGSGRVAGGGGSSYIGGVTSGTTIMYGQTGFVANPDASGNGRVVVRELCGISMFSSTTNTTNSGICVGESVTLTTNAISNYSWSTGATSSSIVVSPTVTTVYSLVATSSLNCTASVSQTVFVNPPIPYLITSNPISNSICAGNAVTLTATQPLPLVTFTAVGTTSWTAPVGVTEVTVLVVAGGGGGGYDGGGGGGGGGVIYNTSYSVTPATSYVVTVGAGGTAVNNYPTNGGMGGNSVFGTLVAIGGDGGYDNHAQQQVGSGNGRTGGSGGGQGAPDGTISGPGFGTTGQGYNGGGSNTNTCGGGGGGAGGVGGAATNNVSGNGGVGFQCNITGVATYYGGGGGGGTWGTNNRGTGGLGGGGTGGGGSQPINGTAGAPNTGGGGGGSGVGGSISGVGGSGIVIIKYNVPTAGTYTWSNGSNSSSIVVSPTVTSTYTVATTNTNACSAVSAPITITVTPNPVLSVSGNTAICVGGSATLTAAGATSYTWSNAATTTSIAVSPVANANYTLTGRTSNCVASQTLDVIVNPLPVINVNNGSICAGGSFTIVPGGANTYTIQGGNAVVSPVANSSYSVSGTSSAGCVSSVAAISNVTVNALPVISIAGANTVCVGSALSLTANGAATYTWNTASNASVISVSPLTSTVYSFNGTSPAGCVSASPATLAVTVNTLPVLSISGTNTLCSGGSVNLTANGASTYSWNTNSNLGTISVSPLTNTVYAVTGANAAGCVGNTATVSLTVNPLPLVSISGSSAICAGGTATLTANGASTYTWNTTSNASSISVSPASSTTYSLNGRSAAGCLSSNTATYAVTVNALPVVSISGTTAVCAGNQVALTASGANTYTWNTNSNATTLSVTPAVSTTYSVSGTSAAGCVGNTATLAVTVNTLPIVTITGTNAVCSGSSATLIANGANTYSWSNSASTSSIVVSPVANANYSVIGISALGCVGNSTVLAVTVNTLPVVSISGTNAICSGSSATLTASGASTYTWNTSSNANTISVSPTSSSTYSLTGRSAAGCLGNTATLAVTVNTLPVVAISGTTAVCAGNSATLTGSGAATYTWNTTSNNSSITVAPAASTSYSLTGASALGCVGNTATLALTVNPNPTLTISGASGICTGQSASLSVNGAATYSWNTGSTSSSLVVTPVSNTTYSVSGVSAQGCTSFTTQLVTVQSSLSISVTGPNSVCYGQTALLSGLGGVTYTWNTAATTATIAPTLTTTTTFSIIGASGTCSNTAVKTITVIPNPTVSITGTTAICAGGSASLTANGATTYSWSTVSTNTSVVVSPSATTVYSVVGSFSTGCLNSTTQTITVYALPVVSISGPSVVCLGGSVSLTANGANTYVWDNAATTVSVVLTPSATSSYSAVGTDTNGCVANASATVTVNPLPVMNLVGTATAICLGDSLSFTASGADTYSWSTGATTASIMVTPTISSTYSVVGTNTFGCTSFKVDSVKVNALPVLTITGNSGTICVGESIILTVNGASTYSWTGGVSGASISISPSVATSYTAVGTSTDACVSKITTSVEVSECTGITAYTAATGVKVYPNPNNGVFTVELSRVNNAVITITNMLGQVVKTQQAEQVQQINIADLDKGMYFINITENNKSVYRTNVVKQ